MNILAMPSRAISATDITIWLVIQYPKVFFSCCQQLLSQKCCPSTQQVVLIVFTSLARHLPSIRTELRQQHQYNVRYATRENVVGVVALTNCKTSTGAYQNIDACRSSRLARRRRKNLGTVYNVYAPPTTCLTTQRYQRRTSGLNPLNFQQQQRQIWSPIQWTVI